MTALLIIDMQGIMQQRIDAGRDTVHPDAAVRVQALADAFRRGGMPVIHIRHREDDPASPLHADASGFPPMVGAEERDGEVLFVKRTSSAFASTDLMAHLRREGITDLVVTGAVAGFCVNSTVRAGADLGFAMTVVRDAVIGFDLPDAALSTHATSTDVMSARVIFDVTMAHLAADFATVTDTAGLLAALSTGPAESGACCTAA